MNNVITNVVDNGLCIGCGLCVAVCTKGNLKISFNNFGEYNPYETGAGCIKDCSLCLDICPFNDNKENEDILAKKLYADQSEVKHTDETGYYLECYVGHSEKNNHRQNGASGGMATWMLEALLEEGMVDRVIAVSPNDNPDKLFKFTLCSTIEEVRNCSSSCYYPVELSGVIKHVLDNDFRYALIALPCVCKSIRLAQNKIPSLKKRIKYLLGLVCGTGKNKYFTEYICSVKGVNCDQLKRINYRYKDGVSPISKFPIKLKYTSVDGVETEIFGNWYEGKIGNVFSNRIFTPKACNFCDDVFAECADVAFMDAWLPEYRKDISGESILLIRNNSLLRMFLHSDDIVITKKEIKEVIESQKGALDSKREGIKWRWEYAFKSSTNIPVKRYHRFRKNENNNILKKIIYTSQYRASILSSVAWKKSHRRIRLFNLRMCFLLLKLRVSQKMYSLIQQLRYKQ